MTATLERCLGELAFTQVQARSPSNVLDAWRWHRRIAAHGLDVPLNVTHDLGVVLTAPPGQWSFAPRLAADVLASAGRLPEGAVRAVMRDWGELLLEISRTAPMGGVRPSESQAVALLLHVLDEAMPASGRVEVPAPPADLEVRLDQVGALVPHANPATTLAALERLVARGRRLLTLCDTLEGAVLGVEALAGGDGAEGAAAELDLLEALRGPDARATASFSLEILPAVQGTRAQRGAVEVVGEGYAGLSRRGSPDALLPSEFAWEDLELARRLEEREALYFSHEAEREEPGRLHLIVIDASASMRGDRAIFARATALALGRRLTLAREDVEFRFFDVRLHEPLPRVPGRLPVARLLGYRGEAGRHPSRVFEELAQVAELHHHRDRRSLGVTLFTHAGLHVSRTLVRRVVERAPLTGVFFLPSRGVLEPDWVELTTRHHVVGPEHLVAGDARRQAAERIARGAPHSVREPA